MDEETKKFILLLQHAGSVHVHYRGSVPDMDEFFDPAIAGNDVTLVFDATVEISISGKGMDAVKTAMKEGWVAP